MAKNEKPKRSGNHACFLGQTGSGKSQALKNVLQSRMKLNPRLIAYDPDGDHQAVHYSCRLAFAKAVQDVMKKGRGGVAYKPSPTCNSQDEFAFFSKVVWLALDGNKPVNVVCEEIADAQLGVASIKDRFTNALWVRGRKYGGDLMLTSQRCQGIPKTMITQANTQYLGRHVMQDAQYLGRLTGKKPSDFEEMQDLEFMIYEAGKNKWSKKRFKYMG